MDRFFINWDSQSHAPRQRAWHCLLLAVSLASVSGVTGAPPTAREGDSDILVARLVADSQKHLKPRNVRPEDPLYQAENFAVELAEDVSEYNVWMVKIILALAAKDSFDDAEYLASRLPGTGRGLAEAELAAILARKGRRKEAEAHLHTAMEQMNRAAGLAAEIMRSRCSLALHHLGRRDEAARLEADLGKVEMLSLLTRLHEENLSPAMTLLDAKRVLVTLSQPGEDERHARFLLACAKQQFKAGNTQLGVPFLDEVGSMAMDRGLPSAQEVLLDLARVAWTSGQAKAARKSMNLFLKCCEAYSDNVEWKAPFIAEAAGVLIDWDCRDEAASWLKVAEASVPHVFVMEAPAAILAIAQQQERLEGVVAGDRLLVAAAKVGRSNLHPRARAEAAVRISLYCATKGRPVPAAVASLLNSAEVEVKLSK